MLHNGLSGILAFFYYLKFGEGSFGHEKYVQNRLPQNRIGKKRQNTLTYINVGNQFFNIDELYVGHVREQNKSAYIHVVSCLLSNILSM
jgi:hypothetical protein